jgi:peptidoglycan/LPS O-acetylase OafA/YrhL
VLLNPIFAAVLAAVAFASAALVLRLSPAARHQVAGGAARNLTVDGLRGWLAVAVFIHHTVITWFFLQGRGWALPPSRLYGQLGQVGVALFFMVTAFLFWGKVIDRRGALDWRGFLVGRLWRLYPAYLVVFAAILLAVAASSGFTRRVPLGELAGAIGSWLIFTYPAAADLNGFAGSGRLIAYAAWSLPYEVLFYAVLPLAGMAVFGTPRPAVALACLLVIAGLAAAGHGSLAVFRPAVLACFLGGIAGAHVVRSAGLAAWCRGRLAGLLGLAALGAVLLGFDTAYTPAATALLTLFFAVVASGQGFRGALDHPAAVWLGQASYSLYLSHGLLIWLVLDRLGGWLDPGHGSAALFLLLAVVTCALLVLVASLLALGVEQPAIAAGRRRALRLPRGRLHPIPGG